MSDLPAEHVAQPTATDDDVNRCNGNSGLAMCPEYGDRPCGLLNSITNFVPDIVWAAAAPAGEVRFLSHAAEQLFGRDRLLARKITWMDLAHEADRELVAAAWARALQSGYLDVEHRVIDATGRTRWIRSRGHAIVGADGTALRIDGVSRRVVRQSESARARRLSIRRAIYRERRRMAAELHDGLGQELAGLSLLAAALESAILHRRRVLSDSIANLRQLLQRTQEHCRDLAHNVYAAAGASPSLAHNLRALVRRERAASGLHCTYRGPARARVLLPQEVSHHLFRIAQEALSNAIRHSGGTQITIELALSPSSVRIVVRDNGRGPGAIGCGTTCGIGCRTMRLRAKSVGGTLRIEPARPSGTEVTAEVPLAVRRRRPPGARRERGPTSQ